MSRRSKLLVFVSCIFASLFTVRIVMSEESVSQEANFPTSHEWGTAEIKGKYLHLHVTTVPDDGRIKLPRLNNSLKSIHLNRSKSDSVKIAPETDHWLLSVPKNTTVPAKIDIEFNQDVYFPAKPRTITSSRNGSYELNAFDAVTHGTHLRYEPQPQKNTVGYWTNVKDWAEWHLSVDTPGTFEVIIRQGCGNGHGGSQVDVSLKDQKLSFVVEETGGFQNWKDRNVGRLTVSETGDVVLQVRPQVKPGGAVMDIQKITLVPAKE